MKEKIVSFEVAKLAKEKGFNERCINVYTDLGKLSPLDDLEYVFKEYSSLEEYLYVDNKQLERVAGSNSTPTEPFISAPTQSMLQAWLREKCGIDCFCNGISSGRYFYEIYNNEKSSLSPSQVGESEYCEALEEGLEKSLKQL